MKRDKKSMDHLVEKIRKSHASDIAYQHLLDTIADDVLRKFGTASTGIVEFIREWRP